MLMYLAALETERDRCYFQEIYEENYLKMFYVARKLLKENSEAENAVHEAFLSLAEHFEKYSKLSCREMGGLCVTITKHKAIDILRQRQHLSDRELEQLVLHYPDAEHDPQEQLERDEKTKRLRRIMEQLPEVMKITLDLKYYYQYDNREIADLMEVSLKTVEMRLYRAKIKMRELMEDETGEGRF